MNPAAITTLRVLLVGALAGSFLGQLLVPVIARANGDQFHEVAHLVVPYSILGIAAIACFQAAVVCIWALLTMVEEGRVYSDRALRWVDTIVWCGGVAAAIVTSTCFHLGFVVGVGGPAALLGTVGAPVAGAAFVLLMLVMRGLLVAAISDRAELSEVI